MQLRRDIEAALGYELEGIMKRVEVLQQDESSKGEWLWGRRARCRMILLTAH